jgi:radical SAM superfamily enzyme YgiQ (UPF0313 family)
MKISFIRPNIGRLSEGAYLNRGRMEPLELAVLAGLTPPDVECVLHDDRCEPVPFDAPTDLVAITVETYTAKRAYEIAGEYRRRGVPVVMGGFHPTLLPDECAEHADAVYLGDAEFLWHQVVADARAGRLKAFYRAPVGAPQRDGVLPRRDLFAGKRYLPVTLMQFGRGCRFSCGFCAIRAFFKRSHSVRPTAEVIAEIEHQERRVIFFVDDNFLSDHEAAKRFLRALVPLRIRWVSQGSIDMTDDPELMDLLEASGCLGHVIGFESLDPRNLKDARKAPNLLHRGWDRYRTQCEILRSHHLQTWAAFTLGYDHDTVESIRETVAFAIDQKFCFAAFNILMPYPATPLYRRLESQGRLLWDGKWWLHPDYRFNHAAFRPANMSPDELTEACWDCRRRWNSTASIFTRLWDFKTHLSSPTRLAVYLGYNPIVAHEARRKQGMWFGLSRH